MVNVPKHYWNLHHITYFQKKDDPHKVCISEITYSENVVIQISKKSHFRGPIDNQHSKRAQELLKSASHDLYQIHRSMSSQLSWKKSLLVTCQILGLLVNILSADEKYPVPNRDCLKISIQTQLSRKQKTFSRFSAAFSRFSWNFEPFEKKMTLIAFVFQKIRTLKTWLDKCLKGPVSEDPSASNMVHVPKHGLNLHHITFIIFIGHFQVNWVGKTLSFWYANFWDWLLRHWLPMKSSLFLIKRI